jgi:N utilization substance protein B
MIYQWDLTRLPPEQVMQGYWGGLVSELREAALEHDAFADQLLLGVARNIDSIDNLIRVHAEHWRLERMSAVDRNILRMAVYELLENTAAPAVVINEALDIGRRFSSQDSARFLNGVLDAIRRSLQPEHEAAENATSP